MADESDYGGAEYDGGGDLSAGSAPSGGFNAARDSQAANESLGLGPNSEFTGGVTIDGAAHQADSGLSFSGILAGAKKAVGYVGNVAAVVYGGPLAAVGAGISLLDSANTGGLFGGGRTATASTGASSFDRGDGGGDFVYSTPLSFSRPSTTLASAGLVSPPSPSIPVTALADKSEPVTPATEAAVPADLTDPSSGGVTARFDWYKLLGGAAAAVAIYKGFT